MPGLPTLPTCVIKTGDCKEWLTFIANVKGLLTPSAGVNAQKGHEEIIKIWAQIVTFQYINCLYCIQYCIKLINDTKDIN